MLIKEVLKWGTEQLKSSSSARLDAEILLSHILKKPATFLLAHDDTEIGLFSLWKFRKWILKRKEGVPVAYMTGHKEFYFLDFEVNRNVLIPRPDTETLVECVIEYIQGLRTKDYGLSKILLLDIGTGSACIPISVCKNVDGLNVVAVDISRKALEVARRNIKKHGMGNRINLIHSDLLKSVPPELFEGKEVIVTANLPYIPTFMKVSRDLDYEPKISLFGGEDGMDLYKICVHPSVNAQDDNTFRFWSEVKPKAIFFELFEDQIAILQAHMPDYRLKYSKNMSGKARVLMMERIG